MCHRRALLIDLEPRVLNQVNNDMPGLFNQARAPSPHARACHMHATCNMHPIVCHPNPNPNPYPNPNANANANASQEEELKDER